MPDPCACGAREPHAEVADCVARLLRGQDALVEVLWRLSETKHVSVARVEIEARESALTLYVTTSGMVGATDLAVLIVGQFRAAVDFGHRRHDLTPIREVYERFKHLDELLGNAAMMPEDPMDQTLWELWSAVKRAVEGM